MSHQRKKTLPQLVGGTKTLITEFRSKTAMLFDGKTIQPMNFKNPQAALSWCEKNAANFYCMHPASHVGN